MQSRQHAPRPDAAQQGSEGPAETPNWQVELCTTPSNSSVLAALTDVELAEGEATSVLQSLLAGDEEVGGDAAWAEGGDHAVADAAPEQAAPEQAAPEPGPRPSGVYGAAWDRHRDRVPDMTVQLSRTHRNELAHFQRVWEQNRARYERVAARADIPPMLIAAIHYRESSMRFDTYLHQGDPLGKPAVNIPRNIPVFHDWEEAAVHALNLKRNLRESVGLTADSTDGVAMATYAEAYNGLGYHNRGLASPYVYAGTDVYTGGRYVADGRFDPNSFDQRLGVMTILSEGGALSESARVAGPDRADREGDQWRLVLRGDQVLRQGAQGMGVRALQERLNAAGASLTVDGDFGADTRRAVEDFQRSQGLKVDGAVGLNTATALDNACGPGETQTPDQQAWGEVLAGRMLLRVGSKGDAVRALQERLRARGYGCQVDGDYGAITRACVVDFQAGQGLSADGIVGRDTASRLAQVVGR